MTVPAAAAAGGGAATANKSAKLFSFGLLSDVQVRMSRLLRWEHGMLRCTDPFAGSQQSPPAAPDAHARRPSPPITCT